MTSKKKRIISIILLIPIIISVVIVLSNINKKTYIDEKEYETSELKEMFLQDAEYIELKLANHLLDGSVTDQNSLNKKVGKINKQLKSNNWSNLEMVKTNNWNGIWFLDENGFLKFKFSSKENEPEWIKDSQIALYIIKN